MTRRRCYLDFPSSRVRASDRKSWILTSLLKVGILLISLAKEHTPTAVVLTTPFSNHEEKLPSSPFIDCLFSVRFRFLLSSRLVFFFSVKLACRLVLSIPFYTQAFFCSQARLLRRTHSSLSTSNRFASSVSPTLAHIKQTSVAVSPQAKGDNSICQVFSSQTHPRSHLFTSRLHCLRHPKNTRLSSSERFFNSTFSQEKGPPVLRENFMLQEPQVNPHSAASSQTFNHL